jgi:phosphotriesterase-related protein
MAQPASFKYERVMSMAFIRTVTGDIEPSALGACDAHEHVLTRGGMAVKLDPDFLLNDRDAAVAELQTYRGLGGGAVIDMMPAGIGRDPDGLREVSKRSGVHIVAATGFHTEQYYDTDHWLYHYSTETIARLFTEEVHEGMDRWGLRGPIVERSEARPGVFKVATGYYKWTALTERWFEAAAMTHASTGIPIASHTQNGVLGDRQADTLIRLGVPPTSIVIGHIDKNVDPYVHRDLAARGVFLEYDGPSRLKYGPDADVVRLIRAAAEGGYVNQILLGLDFARRSYYPQYGGGPGLSYLFNTFLPRLRAEGLEDVVDRIMVDNPSRAFAFAGGTA